MTSELIQHSEIFSKSKRNLLWICALILIFGLANPKNPMVGELSGFPISIDRSHFCIYLLLHLVYLFFGYVHEFYFARIQNTDAGRTLAEISPDRFAENCVTEIGESLKKFRQTITAVKNLEITLPANEPVETENLQISPIDRKSIRNMMTLPFDEVHALVSEFSQKHEGNEVSSIEISQFSSGIIREIQIRMSALIENFLDGKISVLRASDSSKFEILKMNFEERRANLERELNITYDHCVENGKYIKNSASKFTTISNRIHGYSKFMFYVYDGVIPLVLTILSAALLVCYLFNS